MAKKEIKFTDKELQELRELQQNYQQKIFDFGNHRVEKMLLAKRQAELDEQEVSHEEGWAGVQEQEKELVQKLTEKYGPGQLDPTSGVFTPVPAVEEDTAASEASA